MPLKDDSKYLILLEKWLKGAEPHLLRFPERPDLVCYGTGEGGWGVQTNQKAFAAYAMLAADPRFDEKRAGMSREQVRETALGLLRFSLHTHIEGTFLCSDGKPWGHTWISVLGMERMMHAVDALEEHLTDEDKDLLRRVMISESDWLLDHYPIVAGLYNKDGNNKPESNLWNGVFLHRTAMMYPDAERAADYREKGSAFLVNGISVPADAEDGTIVDGKPVSERYVGANFFPSFALNHHGYLNVGYMVICLSNAAMYHFACRARGVSAPEALYRHIGELWELIKKCTFPDGRLLRIGGDTRVRYTYCQDYVIPMWHMMMDLQGDTDCLQFEEGWLKQIEAEMDAGGNGEFLSYRCGSLRRASPLYFTRLESDRAAALSMGLAWRKMAVEGMEAAASSESTAAGGAVVSVSAEAPETWHDPYHGAYLHRSERRAASWVWESAEKPQGLILPPDASDLAEWKENLAGSVSGLGRFTEQRLETHGGAPFAGGFITWGSTLFRTHGLLAEGQPAEQDIARNRLVCAALPDGVQMIVLQRAAALLPRTFVADVKGLHLLIPNDVFNGNHRTYYYEGGTYLFHGHGSAEERVSTGSRWLNIDNRLGVHAIYGADELSIYRPGRREIGLKTSLKSAGTERTMYADVICGPFQTELQAFAAGEAILDAGFVLQSGQSKEETERFASSAGSALALDTGASDLRAVLVRGFDGKQYVLAANFGEADAILRIPSGDASEASDAVDGQRIAATNAGEFVLSVPAGAARLIRW